MHTVIESACTGCDLCREPCPVDCIDLIQLTGSGQEDYGILDARPAQACINCGLCIDACPKALLPHVLYWYRGDIETAQEYDLLDCIECGMCDRVCPSDLPLTQTFTAAREKYRQFDAAQTQAAEIEERYLQHQARLTAADNRIAKRPTATDRQALLNAIQAESTGDQG